MLALPLVGLQLAQMTMGVTDTVMLGWLGPRELAGGALGTQAIFLPYIFGVGFSQAAMPLAAAAQGAGDEAGLRRAVRMGLWVLALYSALVQFPLWHAERILRAAGRSPGSPALAGGYARVAMWSMLPALVITGIRAFLTVVGHAYLLLAVIIVGAVVNGVLNYLLIFGHHGFPAMGVPGSALATTIANLAMATLLLAYAALAPALRRYHILARLWRAGLGRLPRDRAPRLADRGDDHRRGRALRHRRADDGLARRRAAGGARHRHPARERRLHDPARPRQRRDRAGRDRVRPRRPRGPGGAPRP